MKMMMIVLLLLISQHASGVEVYEGKESVLLPCQVPADVSRSSTAAVWDRDGLSNPTVHLRRKSDNLDERDDLSRQNNLYKNRTSMRVDALQTGDLSLTLRKPTVSDSGSYTCITRRAGEDQSKTVVQLKVTEPPPPPPVLPKVVTAMLVTLIILAAALSLFVCCAYKRIKDSKALLPEVVEVPQGEESVLLPFKTPAVLPQDVKVEWTLAQPKWMKVHVYKSGNNLSDKQHQCYRGRTEMKDKDPLSTKDLSLTLKDLCLTDRGLYTCTVYKHERMLLQKVVILSVRAPQPAVVNATDADESVLLPFTTTAGLRQDVTVEWTITEPTKRKVHVYESGNNQSDKQDQRYRGRTEMKDKDPLRTGDLSLTLNNPHLDDSRSYTCTVYNKDGHMLLQKVVTLRVTESLPDIVQATNIATSIELPLKTTADLPQDVKVEWKLTQPKDMTVHVYESGKSESNIKGEDNKPRTEMKKDPLSTKDLSLKLNKPRFSDTGVYTCTVSNKDGDTLLQKSVTLHAMDDPVKIKGAVYGEKSYLLEFNKTDKHHKVSTVEWKLIYPKYKLMKKIPNHQGSEVDFSLNLEDLQLTDSGVYTCTAYNEDGHALLQRSVTLSVRDFQMEVVEVPQGEESVLLPFKTTADLHHVRKVYWMLTEEIVMVDVYESEPSNQQNQQDKRFRGRTKMDEDPLRTGDLGLTLKHPRLDDSRSYTCMVLNKDDRMLLEKVVILKVRATLKGIVADMLPRTRRPPKQEPRNTNHEVVPLMDVHSA